MVNIDLLQKVHDHIEKFPESLDLDIWFTIDTRAAKRQNTINSWDGVRGCFGGLAIHLSGGAPYKDEDDKHRNIAMARARLELSLKETNELLFFDHDGQEGHYSQWRDDLYRSNKGTKEYAAVACAVLRACIARHSPKAAAPLSAVVQDAVGIPAIQVRVKLAEKRSKLSRWIPWRRRAPEPETVVEL